MLKKKNIGLIAHDACKKAMVGWVSFNAKKISAHNLICTGTTGKLIQDFYDEKYPELKVKVKRLKSGPLGGDQQMGALIAGNQIDVLVFLTDPMTMQPHDVDVKALIRLSSIENIVVACTLSSADFIISSSLFDYPYEAVKSNHEDYAKRIIDIK
ncbi:MAG: methylglyoxal synthase [Elusimicrobiota bacterium]|jgi:methylglyoxal synthase|nr:methylglyoxal synthase [Elusimicrobiota bacterium]